MGENNRVNLLRSLRETMKEKPYSWLDHEDYEGNEKIRVRDFPKEFEYSRPQTEVIEAVRRNPWLFFPKRVYGSLRITLTMKGIRMLTYGTLKEKLKSLSHEKRKAYFRNIRRCQRRLEQYHRKKEKEENPEREPTKEELDWISK